MYHNGIYKKALAKSAKTLSTNTARKRYIHATSTMTPNILFNDHPSGSVKTSTDLDGPKRPEHGNVQSNVDPDNSRTDDESDWSTVEDDEELEFILTPSHTPPEYDFAELWDSLHDLALASKREKTYTTTENQNPLEIRPTARTLKSNDATKQHVMHSQLPRPRSSRHDTAKGVFDSLPRKDTGERKQLGQSSVSTVASMLDIFHLSLDSSKMGTESSETPKESATKIHAEKPAQVNSECATKRERRKVHQEREKVAEEAKSESKATEIQEGAPPRKVSKYVAKRNRRKAAKEQQRALEEADNNAIAEAKRAMKRDLTVLGQRQAREQKKKELIERSRKEEEIRKAAQLRQNARIAQREAGMPSRVAYKPEELTKPATKIATLNTLAHRQKEPTKPAPKIAAPIRLALNDHLPRMAQAQEASIKLASITIPTFSKDYSVAMKEYVGRLNPIVGVKFASHTETHKWIMTILLETPFEEKADIKDKSTKLGIWLSQRCWLLSAKKYAPDVPLPRILTEHERPEHPDLKTLLNMFKVLLGLHEPNRVANMYMFFSEAWCVERGLDLDRNQGVIAMMRLDWWKRRGRDGLWYDSV